MDGRPTTMHSHLNVCTLVPRKIKEEVEAAIADAVAKDAAALPAAVAKVAGSHRAKKQRTSTTSSSQRSVIECFSTSSKVSADLDQRMLRWMVKRNITLEYSIDPLFMDNIYGVGKQPTYVPAGACACVLWVGGGCAVMNMLACVSACAACM